MIRFAVPVLVTLGLFAACQAAAAQETTEAPAGLGALVDRSQASPPEQDRPPVDQPPSAEELKDTLSITGRIAQLMILTPAGLMRPNNTDRITIEDFPPGGIVLSKMLRPQDTAEYIRVLRGAEVEVKEKLPLLIGTNFFTLMRGGARTIPLYLNIPSMLTWASGGVSDSTQGLLGIIMQDARRMGFNMHLGPSLELSNQIEPKIGNVFNFGNDPEFTSALAVQIARACQENGIVWLPMGFPGGGQNLAESGRAVLLTPKSQLRHRDLLPFERAIEAGVEMMHVGNTLVPTLDGSTPASLSPFVMKELLRDILGFEGLIVAGPIDALAIRGGRTTAEAAVLALNAGADMLYWESAGLKSIAAIAIIIKAMDNGTLDEAVIDHAFERVVAFKRERGLLGRAPPKPKDSVKLTKERAKVAEPYRIERRGVTLIRNDRGLLPLTEAYSMPVGVTGMHGVEELADAIEEYMKPIMRQRIRSARHLGRLEDFEIERIVRSAGGTRTIICVLSNSIAPGGQMRLIKLLKETGSKIVVVLVGYPSNLSYFDDADAIVAVYSNPSVISETMRAVADVLIGNAPVEVLPALSDLQSEVGVELAFDAYDVIRSPVGRLPITIDERFGAGFSLSYRPLLALHRVQWDFGDGSKSRDPIAAHAYSKPGNYQVTLSVESKVGETATGHFGVVVK